MYLPLSTHLISIWYVTFFSLFFTPGIFSFPGVSFSTQKERHKIPNSLLSFSHDKDRNKINLYLLPFFSFSSIISSSYFQGSSWLLVACSVRGGGCLISLSLVWHILPAQHCSLHCHPWRMTWPDSLYGLFLASEDPCVSLTLSFSACFTYHFKHNGLELPINTDRENALNKISVDIIIFYNKILLGLSQIRKLHAAPFAIFTWNDQIILSRV